MIKKITQDCCEADPKIRFYISRIFKMVYIATLEPYIFHKVLPAENRLSKYLKLARLVAL